MSIDMSTNVALEQKAQLEQRSRYPRPMMNPDNAEFLAALLGWLLATASVYFTWQRVRG